MGLEVDGGWDGVCVVGGWVVRCRGRCGNCSQGGLGADGKEPRGGEMVVEQKHFRGREGVTWILCVMVSSLRTEL